MQSKKHWRPTERIYGKVGVQLCSCLLYTSSSLTLNSCDDNDNNEVLQRPTALVTVYPSAPDGFFMQLDAVSYTHLDVYKRQEEDSAVGRADAVVYMPDAVFVFELKYDGSAEEMCIRDRCGRDPPPLDVCRREPLQRP